MNLAWLWLIIPPPYAIIAGYVWASAITHEVEDANEIPMALLWPGTLVILAIWHLIRVGMYLHGPERKRQREKAIARDERAIYGRPMS